MDLAIRTLRTHLDLNYNFGYNPDYSLDSARVGNETRYINHGSDAEGLSNAIADSAPLSVPIYCD